MNIFFLICISPGLLARREVAFCNMGMSKTQNRLQVIDYIDTPLDFAPIHITYRLPKSDSDLDLTLFDIVQPEFFLLTLGPLLSLAVLGIVVHILTRSCTETIFNFTKEGVRYFTFALFSLIDILQISYLNATN